MTSNRWTPQIDSVTASFKNTFGNLTAEQLNRKPCLPTGRLESKTWSIAQNVDHLMVIHATYYPVIRAVREGTYHPPFVGKFRFMVNFFGKVILNSVQPDRRKKMKTFPLWEPSSSDIAGDVIPRFEKHQEELKQLILSSHDLVEKGTVISSSANKNIVYRLDTAFDIIVTHEQRHFEQAREVLQKIKSN